MNHLPVDFESRTKNTRDAGDLEPVVRIPSSWFLTLEELSQQVRMFGRDWDTGRVWPYPSDRQLEV